MGGACSMCGERKDKHAGFCRENKMKRDQMKDLKINKPLRNKMEAWNVIMYIRIGRGDGHFFFRKVQEIS
jgi:hypothetical protein